MAQPKGSTGNPNGRPKGSPNKANAMAREAIAAFVDGNVERLNGWLDMIAQGVKHPEDEDKYIVYPNPKGAFDSFMSVVEYNIPKLTRVDSTVKADVDMNINWPLPQSKLDE